MSSFPLNPETATPAQLPSRKRKAPGSHLTSNTVNGGDPTTAADNLRKQAYVTAACGTRETNMMSFEGTQAYLEDGELKADDGTTLEVNGMLDSP